MAISYMQRRKSGIYEFRKRLPESLAGKPAPEHVRQACPDLVNLKTGCFKGELVRSLGTNKVGPAKKADLAAAHAAIEMIESAQRLLETGPSRQSVAQSSLTPADLEDIKASVHAEILRHDDEMRDALDPRIGEQTREERATRPNTPQVHGDDPDSGMRRDRLVVHGMEIEYNLDDHRALIASRNVSTVKRDIPEVLGRVGLRVQPSSPEIKKAGLAIIEGRLKGYEDAARRQLGNAIPTPVVARKPSLKLSEAHLAWQHGGGASGAKKPGRSALLEAAPAVRRFIELHGDLPLSAITKDLARAYRDALVKLPKRLPLKLRSLPLPDLLKRDLRQYAARDAVTVNKMLDMLAAIVSRAKREGDLDKVPGYVNPFDRDVKLIVNNKAKAGRAIFTPSDLEALFGSAVFTKGKRSEGWGGCEAAFWFPLIGLMSGMRLDELAGLRIADLRQDEETGVWVFDIHHRADRSVKTESSTRLVPVHPALIDIGLLAYRQSLLDSGAKPEGSLWPLVRSAPGRAESAAWSQWFGRYLSTEAGIDDSRKVFHSFRHGFKQRSRDARIEEEIHDALTGHANSSVGRGYGGVSLKRLAEAMGSIETPKAVAGLRWER